MGICASVSNRKDINRQAHNTKQYQMATNESDISRVLELLGASSAQSLSIEKLAEPLLGLGFPYSPPKNTSDASSVSNVTANTGAPNPATLEADLNHYKVYTTQSCVGVRVLIRDQELFTKLRFSYVEQVTKEKFLRAVVGDPPLHVGPTENADLEAQLSSVKALLRQQKNEGTALVEELTIQGRDLSRRHQSVQMQIDKLRTLPDQNAELRQNNAELSKRQLLTTGEPNLSMPLAQTQAVVRNKEAELEDLDAQLKALEAEVAQADEHLTELEESLRQLETQKAQAIRAAKSARRDQEEGSNELADDLEARGRWLKAAYETMQIVLPVK